MTDPTPPRQQISLTLDADTRAHFATQKLRVPLVKRLTLRNEGSTDVAAVDVEVAFTVGSGTPWRRRIEGLRAGMAHNIDDVEVGLDPEELRALTERTTRSLRAIARTGDVGIATADLTVELFPLSHWPGLRTLPEVLASFVLPAEPVVADVLARAAVHLRSATGDGALDGYQRRDPQRVVAIGSAIRIALAELAIAEEPASPGLAQEGAAIQLPDEIARSRRASCLDIALLYAAGLERSGLHPLVIVTSGRALVGFWLTADTFSEGALEDGLRLRKRVDLAEIRVVDPSELAKDARAEFALACAAGRRLLDDLAEFRCVVDVARCRQLGVTPLPVPQRPAAAAAPADLDHGATAAAVPLAPAAAPAATKVEETPASRLDRWRRKLLDLSLRNRLINFRPTKLAIPLVPHDLGALEDALANGADFVLRSAPPSETTRRARLAAEAAAAPGTGEHAQRATFLASELGQRRIHTSLAKEELEERLVELWRHARVAREESGANVLFLALGTLRWFETPASQEQRTAPLLLVPLELERISAREGFRVRLGEEDARINVTLLEKLALEFGLAVEGLAELTEDENGFDVHAVLQRFRRAVRDIDRWDVAEEAWIAPFSFSKFLMWRDLQEQADALLASPVLRHLVEQPGRAFAPEAEFPEAARLDDTLAPDATFCPLDADSSQLAAVVAAASGRSFVLEGPPGTGKSQTIANLIAQCLAQGKRVLFVAEKMAALEVVHHRLCNVGLGPFCLELHSKESSKRAVLDSMQEALDAAATREPHEWGKVTAQLGETRAALNAYVHAIHTGRPLGETVYQATAALIGLRSAPRVALAVEAADRLEAPWVDARREIVDALRAAAADLGALAQHPLRAVQRSRWETTLPERAAAVLARASAGGDALATASARAGTALGVDVSTLGQAAFAAFVALSRGLLDTPGAAEALLTEPGFDDLRPRLLAAIEDVRQKDLLRGRVREAFTDAVLAEDLAALRQRLRHGIASFWPLSWVRCRAVRKLLAPHAKGQHLGANQELAARLDDALDLRDRMAALARDDHIGCRYFGARLWQSGDPGADGPMRLTAAVEWAADMRAALRTLHEALDGEVFAKLRARAVALAGSGRDELAAGARAGDALREFATAADAFAQACGAVVELLELDRDRAFAPAGSDGPWLAQSAGVLRALTGALDSLAPWCHWRRVRAQAVQHDLAPLVAAVEAGTLAAGDLAPAFERAFREAWLAATCDADPLLREFAGREHERRIQRFAELDKRNLELVRALLHARLAARVPRGPGEPAASSELGILLRELAKKTRHKPLRRLFAEIPNLLPRLKPCFLMSPLSVAQYLAAGQDLFDVVVFDEASQITVSDAVGALARGRAGVVVGDSRQLPPTTFFQRMEEGEDDVDDVAVEELESILDECRSAGFVSLRLRWHYRSRHESLIAFSNWHYYDNALLTFPAAFEVAPHLGVSLVPVEGGVYDRSGTRTNRKEAESVVQDLLARLRAPGDPAKKPSAGIVTFSQAQQTLVETLLDEERRQDPSLEPYFGAAVPEPVFVKNLENVQGDERDVILFSIGYGPDAQGRVAMSFGPLNVAGGERRLNVAITRARQQVVVHATLRAAQIDLSRTNALGVKHLRSFLDYAARGPRAIAEALTLDPQAAAGSAFEADVRAALAANGHDVAVQVGCSGYRIDLAVRDPVDPGRFRLGIECDGAFYHAATTARDRDRLRQVVLERLGWRLARVWSNDWWRSRQREVQRLEAILAAAPRTSDAPPPVVAAVAPSEPVAGGAPESKGTQNDNAPAEGALPDNLRPYRAVRVDRTRGPFEAATPAALADVIHSVLTLEAPIHGELLVRRVGAFFELPRVTARTRARVLETARGLPPPICPVEHGEFLWPPGTAPAGWDIVRVPNADDDTTYREAEHIPPEEIANAAAHVVRAQVALGREDLVREVAALLGFARAGTRVRSSVGQGIELAFQRGALVENQGRVTSPA